MNLPTGVSLAALPLIHIMGEKCIHTQGPKTVLILLLTEMLTNCFLPLPDALVNSMGKLQCKTSLLFC